MPATVWILNVVVLAVVLESDVGTRKIGWFRALRPLATVLVVIPFFVKHPQTSGRGLLFELALAALGIVLGLIATLGFLKVFGDSRDGRLKSRAGGAYAAFWTTVIGARLLFSYGSVHWFSAALGRWLATNHVTTDGLTDGLILMALALAMARCLRFVAALLASPPVEVREARDSRAR
ncbi:MAG: integral rane protein [Acidimicrobiaceae bacterium]|nr:integral rane protein [Acidimicrobiaceae bacterium]